MRMQEKKTDKIIIIVHGTRSVHGDRQELSLNELGQAYPRRVDDNDGSFCWSYISKPRLVCCYILAMYGGLEHLKIETRLINERFASVMGECDLEAIGTPSIFKLIRSVGVLVRMLSTSDLSCEENTTRCVCVWECVFVCVYNCTV